MASVSTSGFPKEQECVDNSEHLQPPSQEPEAEGHQTTQFDYVQDNSAQMARLDDIYKLSFVI